MPSVRHPIALLWSLTFVVGAQAEASEPLTPELAARIEVEQQAELKRIEQAHGNLLPGQMSSEERRQVISEEAAVRQAVLEKHGVSDKELSRYVAKEPLQDRRRALQEMQRLEAERAASGSGRTGSAMGSEEQASPTSPGTSAPPEVEPPAPARTAASTSRATKALSKKRKRAHRPATDRALQTSP